MSSRSTGYVVSRRASVPDKERAERCLRLPEFGPRLFFFSGGSALRETSRVLKAYTHNSIHLITPFDSGGSSAVLREAFQILGVGDLRNRLMALADETSTSEPAVRALFAHRLPAEGSQEDMRQELEEIVDGKHSLVQAIPKPLRSIILTHLRKFAKKMPADFDLRVASLGNLILAGGYLVNQRDIEAVLYLFSELVNVRGIVRPTVTENAHLVAIHESGERTVGQHRLGKPESMERGRIEDLVLVSSLTSERSLNVEADEISLQLIDTADLLVFPMGSLFGSVLCNLLPRGIGRAVESSACARLYIPNPGEDPEMQGYTIGECASKISEFVRRDSGTENSRNCVLDFVVVDSKGLDYGAPLDLDELKEQGVAVIDADLQGSDRLEIHPRKLTEVLISIA